MNMTLTTRLKAAALAILILLTSIPGVNVSAASISKRYRHIEIQSIQKASTKVGKYYFHSGKNGKVYISKKKSGGKCLKSIDANQGIVTNGKYIYYMDSNIMRYDISTGKKKMILKNVNKYDYPSLLHAYGNKVYLSADKGYHTNIYEIRKGKAKILLKNASGTSGDGTGLGKYIVFYKNNKVKIYNCSNRKIRKVTNAEYWAKSHYFGKNLYVEIHSKSGKQLVKYNQSGSRILKTMTLKDDESNSDYFAGGYLHYGDLFAYKANLKKMK